MLQLFLIGIIKPLAFPVYCLCGLTLAGVFLWSVWTAGKDGVARLRRLHQIPCDRCVFFTGDYRLKCTVYPLTHSSHFRARILGYWRTMRGLPRLTCSLPPDNALPG